MSPARMSKAIAKAMENMKTRERAKRAPTDELKYTFTF